jgi:uncharacterized damage-inducible protein DinB
MTNKEFFVYTLEDEIPRFERVFKAIPDNIQDDVRAHPKNQNAQEIITTLAYESEAMPLILQEGQFDFSEADIPEFKTVNEMVKIFKKNMEKAIEIVEEMSEEEWEEPAKMLSGGEVAWEDSKEALAWGMLFDAIHHRGQLSTHIRPLGGKVPSIYGPSGDSEM